MNRLNSDQIEHNYLSPDGFYIYFEHFPTKELADEFFKKWKKAYENQGYYSSPTYGRIPLSDLDHYCEYKEIPISDDDIDDCLFVEPF